MIVFPVIFLVTLMFIFTSSVEAILAQQTKLNCPYPINAGIGNLTVQQNFPSVNYTITYDTDSTEYHITLFNCREDFITHTPAVNTVVYTSDVGNGWFDLTNRASGYMFYISQSISAFFEKIVALGNLAYLIVFAPAQVSGLAFFAYIQLILFSFIAFGTFMVIRG